MSRRNTAETASMFVAICLTTNESNRVTELIVACSSWRQWATPWMLTQSHCV